MGEAERIVLSGGKAFQTDKAEQCWKVMSGTVLIYIVCIEKGKLGRRYYLAESGPDSVIPSLSYNDSEGVLWQFLFVSLESAELKEDTDNWLEVAGNFARKINLPYFGMLGFEEAVAEQYRMMQVKNNAFIYQTKKDHNRIYEEGLQSILGVFDKKSEKETAASDPDQLYEACRLLCMAQKIPLEPREKVEELGKEQLTVEDISRVSNFIARKVVLEDEWYKKDVGSFLGFRKENHIPVAVIQTTASKHLLLNYYPDTGNVKEAERDGTPVTSAVADTIEDAGYVFYEPLPDRSLRWRDIWLFILKQFRARDFIIYILMALAGTLIGLLIPELNMMIYDRYIPQRDSFGLIGMGLMVLSFTIGNVLFGIVRGLAGFRLNSFPRYHLEAALYHRLFNLPQEVLSQMDSGDLASRVLGLAQELCSVTDAVLTNGIVLLMSGLYLIRMYQYAGALAWIALLLSAVYIAISLLFSFRQLSFMKEEMRIRGEISADLFQFVSGVSKIRLSGTEDNVLLQYMKKYTQYKKTEKKGDHYTIVENALAAGISGLITAVLYAYLIWTGLNISAGSCIAFFSAFGSFFAAISSAAGLILTLQQVRPSMARADFLLQTRPEISKNSEMPGELNGEIEASHISFSYEKEGKALFDQLNLHINAGEYVGIVGPSGSGKSTLLKLLLGFEKPDIGKVYFDGKDISHLDLRELRKKCGVVLQNGKLIAGSILENITITNPEVPFDRVEEVIREVGLEDDIRSMPMRIHTMLSEDSGTISGGQKQRILIARALVAKPAIVLFDEATSALDNITQRTVCETLEKMNMTRIVIAHRLSTIEKCDRIIVLNQGRVVEEGNYAQLMKNKGLFYEMSVRQIA